MQLTWDVGPSAGNSDVDGLGRLSWSAAEEDGAVGHCWCIVTAAWQCDRLKFPLFLQMQAKRSSVSRNGQVQQAAVTGALKVPMHYSERQLPWQISNSSFTTIGTAY